MKSIFKTMKGSVREKFDNLYLSSHLYNLCHQLQPGTRAATGSSCVMDPTNLVSFCRTGDSGGRDGIEGIGARERIQARKKCLQVGGDGAAQGKKK